jgi:uncharacterized phage-like protein YoqJ
VRIGIVGSRPKFKGQLAQLEGFVRHYVSGLPEGTVVISGGAPGVDSWAEEAAIERGLDVEVYEPQWRRPDGTTDRGAGFKRNQVIVDKSDAVIAFWDGKSRGTADTIGRCEKQFVPHAVLKVVDGEAHVESTEEPHNLYLPPMAGH